MLDRMKPEDILKIIVERYKKILKENLVGIYVHGSIAFNCFNYDKSDIDFIVVIKEKLKAAQKEEIIELLLDLNQFAPKKGFEMSVVLLDNTRNFKYPTPFELHFSNAHINNYRKDIAGYSEKMHGTDKDLAVHFTVIKERGIVSFGSDIEMVFGDVPIKYYEDSIKEDLRNAEDSVKCEPIYIILNLCRSLAYFKDRKILSKLEGANWAVKNLNSKYVNLIENVKKSYVSTEKIQVNQKEAEEFYNYAKSIIFKT